MCSEVELKIGEIELNADKCIIELKDAVKKSRTASGYEFDDAFLLKFLRSRRYKVDETRILLESYISLFTKYPYFFHGVDYSRKGFESGAFQVLRETNFNGETVAVIDISEWDPREVNVHQVLAAIINGLELAAINENAQENGFICIVNMQGLGFKHLLKIGISEIQLSILLMDYSLPIKWQKMIILNENAFTNIVFKVGKPLLSKDFKERLVFVGRDLKQLHQHVSRNILPAKFGGIGKQREYIDCFNVVKNDERKLLQLWQQFKLDFN